jgi:hypothetical protein
MSSNSKGKYRTTAKLVMAAFDKLPSTARTAIANSAFNWVPQQYLTRWRRGEHGCRTGKEIAATVTRWDNERTIKDRKKVWGITPDRGRLAQREGHRDAGKR